MRENRKHILGIEGMSFEEFSALLSNASSLVELSERDIKKAPALRGKTVINLFFENSTRTRTSFEIAAKRLSADAVNISSSGSSTKKGETLLDTARTLEAMSPDVIVMRHAASGAPHFLAKHLKSASIVNAGDGTHEHPTQALLDCLSLMQRFGGGVNCLKKKRIAIVGDIWHSRVARSNIYAHALLGNEIHLVGPTTFLPAYFKDRFPGNIKVFNNLVEGIEGADIIMVLRIQLERQSQHFIPTLQQYTDEFIVTEGVIQKYAPNAVVMHPGPANRGVEIQSSLMDSSRSLVSNQVTNGVAVRMACLIYLCTGEQNETVN